ncbi:hypothetical protein [Dietzia timorensis]|uniref:Uncharacterized protein n=1 Tax=Dietzia timorensis TaxID=499555 RepID=A0A173LIP2_9ACTN|nr:hypothetical protein [Dietzia timorensis]ANI92186.1 Hypothetical protein BJL86_1404 [Dietzia timorensis]
MTIRNIVRGTAVAGIVGIAFAMAPAAASAQAGGGSLGAFETLGLGSIADALNADQAIGSVTGSIGENATFGSITTDSLIATGDEVDSGSVNGTANLLGSVGGSVGEGSAALNTDDNDDANLGTALVGSLDAGSAGLATGSTADNQETAAGSLGTLFGMLGGGDANENGTGEG